MHVWEMIQTNRLDLTLYYSIVNSHKVESLNSYVVCHTVALCLKLQVQREWSPLALCLTCVNVVFDCNTVFLV